MIEKQLLNSLLGKIRHGGVGVTYWDGDSFTFGPTEPYFHLHIKSPKVIRAIFKNMSLGFGESYSDGSIEVTGDLRNIARLVAENQKAFAALSKALRKVTVRKNIQSKQKSYIAHHYDLGNDFYKLWLDKSLTYSCAYFKTENDTLETAQARKVDYILRKLQLQKGSTLLDIGSGWGTLLITAAKKYGIVGHGVTLSEEQLAHAREAAEQAKVSDRVTFELANYQELPSRGLMFDRIVSVGMFEHVGQGNHNDYYRAIDAMLKPEGVSLLHTITQQTELPVDPWIDKYIFPGGYLPSNREIVQAFPAYNFRLIDYENLRIHYAMTLEEWMKRYETHRPVVIKKFDERFYRTWHLWLASSAAGFRYGELDLGQYVFTKGPQNNLPLTRDFLYS
ncbi:MAG TPA: cyclopropane-fatty-acyl-phospholipid synthase family protein [Candidatus Saccharimonadales bacterium]|nr:cyclopropane-fatty-acyl-phospholipid synthase family protein [Candidatus Saccharimonadales bacterium]